MLIFHKKKIIRMQTSLHEKKCQELLEFDEIRFVGIINKLGNLIEGGFKKNVRSLVIEKEQRMMYMQMALEIAMRKDFDSSLGEIDYLASKRKNVVMISIPVNDKLILISAEPTASPEEIVIQARKIFLGGKL